MYVSSYRRAKEYMEQKWDISFLVWKEQEEKKREHIATATNLSITAF